MEPSSARRVAISGAARAASSSVSSFVKRIKCSTNSRNNAGSASESCADVSRGEDMTKRIVTRACNGAHATHAEALHGTHMERTTPSRMAGENGEGTGLSTGDWEVPAAFVRRR